MVPRASVSGVRCTGYSRDLNAPTERMGYLPTPMTPRPFTIRYTNAGSLYMSPREVRSTIPDRGQRPPRENRVRSSVTGQIGQSSEQRCIWLLLWRDSLGLGLHTPTDTSRAIHPKGPAAGTAPFHPFLLPAPPIHLGTDHFFTPKPHPVRPLPADCPPPWVNT